MAEVVNETSPAPERTSPCSPENTTPSTDANTPLNPTPVRLGRRPSFTPADDLIIVREVAAAKAHSAPFGEVLKRFNTAAEQANANANLSAKVTSKRLQDRFKKLMDMYERKDASERRMSGIGGEVGELDELLAVMLDAQKDLKANRDAERVARAAVENRKEQFGRALVATSLARRSSDEEGEGEGTGLSRVKRHKVSAEEDEGLETLAMTLKETDMARIAVERERLALDRERMKREASDRAAERELRREDREARDKLELEKFKLMMETFASARK